MHFFTMLFGLALANAAALPAAYDDKAGHLTYGDVELDLKTGCQSVPQNTDDHGPKPSNYFTKLQVNAGYTCELHRAPECDEDTFKTLKGPAQEAEYVSSWLFSAKCVQTPNSSVLS
ncbi:hypothetical protein SLS60_007277 [Paraconiothyrium brasiliense]|uniref:Uncharacterized protein n=1 Tax=Paraconiothyrium brasiliense TaxID=300254 RepID=A0ABR3R5Q0_9PLEO